MYITIYYASFFLLYSSDFQSFFKKITFPLSSSDLHKLLATEDKQRGWMFLLVG